MSETLIVREPKALDKWLVNHPVSVIVGLVLVCFLGAVALFELPIQLTPDVEEPAVSISVAWPGASPSEVEAEILRPLEEQLNDIPGLERLESSANFGSGRVSMDFSISTDPDAAIVQVANRLASVEELPDAAAAPQINPSNATGPPLAVITLAAAEGEDIAKYRTYVEDRVAPEFGRIKGVAEVDVVGGRNAEVQLDVDPGALFLAGLGVSDLSASVGEVLRDRSAGAVEQGKRRYLVRTDLRNERAEEFGALVLGKDERGGPVTLRDIGTAKRGFRRASSVTYINKEQAIILLLRRQPGFNVLDATRGVIDRLDEMTPKLQRDGLKPSLVFDQREYIEGALTHVVRNLVLGAVLATVVLLLFLRSWRAALLVAGAIPASLAATVLGLGFFGRSINVISIAGVTFAVGMVLDNAIVVVEAVAFWRSRGHQGKDAALRAGSEVGSALVASTLTSLVVFLPILAWKGQAAQLIADLAIAISLALFASLLYSRLVVPSVAGFIWARREAKAALPDKDQEAPGKPDSDKKLFYLDSRLGRLGVAIGIPLVALGLAAALFPSLEYLPNGNRKLIYGILVPPPGYGVPELDAIARKHQADLDRLRSEERAEGKTRRAFFVGSPERIFAGVVTWDTETIPKAVEAVRETHAQFPGTFSLVRQASLFGGRIGGGRSVELDLLGSNLGDIESAAGKLIAKLKEEMPGTQVRPIPDLGARSLELRIEPRLERMAAAGVSAEELSAYTSAAIDGYFAGEVTLDEGSRRDVLVRLRPEELAGRSDWPDHMSRDQLAQLPLRSASGQPVALGDLATMRMVSSPTSVQRVDERRTITLQIAPPENVALEQAIVKTREAVLDLRGTGDIPRSIDDRISGTASDLDLAKTKLGYTLLFAFLVTYLLLSALLENFVAPLPIIAAVPLAAAGGVLGFQLVSVLLESQALDIFSAAGFLMLIGLVVNNAILIVDGALGARDSGASPREAVKSAVRRRLRPILMTAATSVIGLAPLVFYTGTGSELYRGIGSIVLGGMVLSTAITLVVTPALLILTGTLKPRKASE